MIYLNKDPAYGLDISSVGTSLQIRLLPYSFNGDPSLSHFCNHGNHKLNLKVFKFRLKCRAVMVLTLKPGLLLINVKYGFVYFLLREYYEERATVHIYRIFKNNRHMNLFNFLI